MPLYREAVESDVLAICLVGEEINSIHHAAYPSIFAGSPLEPTRDSAHWASSIGKPTATTFVAEEAGQIVGFVNVSVHDESHSLLKPLRVARVGSLGVSTGHRGQGVGKSLMRHAETWAQSKGAVELRLNVWAFNGVAMQLYQELGYELRLHQLAKALPAEA
jgi:ribosomal protein S18 acetylase RimI-like enzyme